MSLTFKSVIEKDAEACYEIAITIGRSSKLVVIRDLSVAQRDDIRLEDEEADWFIEKFDALTEQAPDELFEDALKRVAKPYIDRCWQ